jgi:hypothetical protein
MGRILVLAGVNGAGKSSLLGTWLEAEGLSWFNPDSFTRRLVEAGWPLPEANAEAWQEGTRRLRQAMADGTDFAFETTLGGNTIPRLLREACERHQVAIWFCGLADVELHIARVPRGWPPVATIFRWRRSTRASIRRARTCWTCCRTWPSCMSTTTAPGRRRRLRRAAAGAGDGAGPAAVPGLGGRAAAHAGLGQAHRMRDGVEHHIRRSTPGDSPGAAQ